MSEVQLLNKVSYPQQSKAMEVLDGVLFCAREGLGFEEITFKLKENPKPGEPSYHQEQAKKVNNVFVRVLCSIAAFTVLLVPTLIALAIKCCLKSAQDKDIEKMNNLVEKHTTKTESSSPASKTASITLTREEKKTETQTRSALQDKKSTETRELQKPQAIKNPATQTKGLGAIDESKEVKSPISESQEQQRPKGMIDLQLSYWEDLYWAKSNEIADAAENLKPIYRSELNQWNKGKIADFQMKRFKDLADFADKAISNESYADLLKKKDVNEYLAGRIFKLQGGKTYKEWVERGPKILKDLSEKSSQAILKQVALELKEKGYIELTFEDEPAPPQKTPQEEVFEFYRLSNKEGSSTSDLQKRFDDLIKNEQAKNIILKDYKSLTPATYDGYDEDFLLSYIRSGLHTCPFDRWKQLYEQRAILSKQFGI